MRIGARRRATNMVTDVIHDLAGADPTSHDTLAAEAYGFAHLTRALLAARSGQPEPAHAHLNEAARIALTTGDCNGLQQHFGPTNVAVWRASIGTELREASKVYERAIAANIDMTALGSKVRIGTLHLDLARALAQDGGPRDMDALRHPDLADQNSPQRTRHDPLARELLIQLDMRVPRRSWELNSLRNRFGLTVATT